MTRWDVKNGFWSMEIMTQTDCTAVALVYKFLQQFYSNIGYYIPDRYDEGYGVSKKGIDYANETGVKLIIILDCGIKAIEEIAYAKNLALILLSVTTMSLMMLCPMLQLSFNPKTGRRQISSATCGCG